MNRTRALVVLLACAAAGISGALHAQARGSLSREARSNETQIEKPPLVLDEATRASRIAEMETWLGRLVGRFHGEGRTFAADRIDQVHATAVCNSLGDGPGLRCIVRMTLPGQAELSGSLPIMYFGINPGSLEIQLVVVDPGQVGGRSGRLAGDTVDFSVDNWKVCHKVPWGACWVFAELTAKPAGDIFVKFAHDSWLNGRKTPNSVRPGHSGYTELHLYRELPVDAEGPRNTP